MPDWLAILGGLAIGFGISIAAGLVIGIAEGLGFLRRPAADAATDEKARRLMHLMHRVQKRLDGETGEPHPELEELERRYIARARHAMLQALREEIERERAWESTTANMAENASADAPTDDGEAEMRRTMMRALHDSAADEVLENRLAAILRSEVMDQLEQPVWGAVMGDTWKIGEDEERELDEHFSHLRHDNGFHIGILAIALLAQVLAGYYTALWADFSPWLHAGLLGLITVALTFFFDWRKHGPAWAKWAWISLALPATLAGAWLATA